jgi:hypothetical protein
MPKTSHLSVVETDRVLILHMEFKWIKPSIWRRVAVPENITGGGSTESVPALRPGSFPSSTKGGRIKFGGDCTGLVL